MNEEKKSDKKRKLKENEVSLNATSGADSIAETPKKKKKKKDKKTDWWYTDDYQMTWYYYVLSDFIANNNLYLSMNSKTSWLDGYILM